MNVIEDLNLTPWTISEYYIWNGLGIHYEYDYSVRRNTCYFTNLDKGFLLQMNNYSYRLGIL